MTGMNTFDEAEQPGLPGIVLSSDGLGVGTEARPYLASHMRCDDEKPRFRVGPDGAVLDDDDFIFDALIRIEGDFDEGERVAYAQWIAAALNAADAKLPRMPVKTPNPP